MVVQKDEIVPIPPNRVRYFGTTGKMLLPSPATIAAVIDTVPAHKLITTDSLRRKLRAQFEVDGVCPVTTQKSLQALAHDAKENVAYWRVIKKDGALISKYPGGVDGHATLLRKEGFSIDTHSKTPKVKQFAASLVE